MSKPRIITESVERLGVVARELREGTTTPETAANILDNIAGNLDKYDARETRLDPGQRKKRA